MDVAIKIQLSAKFKSVYNLALQNVVIQRFYNHLKTRILHTCTIRKKAPGIGLRKRLSRKAGVVKGKRLTMVL